VEIPEDVEMKVSGYSGRVKSRSRIGAVFGPLLSSKRYIIHNCNLVNTTRGILERVFRVRDKAGDLVAPRRPDPQVFKQRLRTEELTLLRHPTKPVVHQECTFFVAWLEVESVH
jgi:hypothetical protein